MCCRSLFLYHDGYLISRSKTAFLYIFSKKSLCYFFLFSACSTGCLQTPLSGSLSENKSNFANRQNQQIGSAASKLLLAEKQGQWSKRDTSLPVGGVENSVWFFVSIVNPPHPLYFPNYIAGTLWKRKKCREVPFFCREISVCRKTRKNPCRSTGILVHSLFNYSSIITTQLNTPSAAEKRQEPLCFSADDITLCTPMPCK